MKARTFALAIASVLFAFQARADFAVATFEDVNPGVNAVKIDFRSTNGQFQSGGFGFNNFYTPPSQYFGDYYSGFAVSSKIDNVLVNSPGTSEDYAHQNGAYAPQPNGAPGTGAGGSATYGVVYNYYLGNAVINLPSGYDPVSIDVANTTYVASSILYGDAFSRAFVSGDYLKLTVLGFSGSGATGSVVATTSLFLADYREGGRFLLDHFQTLDLSGLVGANSLAFELETNVTNQFGPSVPFGFAVDNVIAGRAVPEPSAVVLIGIGGVLVVASRRRSSRV